MRKLDQMAIVAKTDEHVLNQLILENEGFIIKCCSSTTHRYITKSDDEWSVALMAFSQAVQDYSAKKGSFLSFAKIVISRRLIDHSRSEQKLQNEILVQPSIFDTEPEEDEEELPLRMAVAEKVSLQQDDSLILEIEAVNQILKNYGFTFFDLVDCSPKAEKTKAACAKAVLFILNNHFFLSDLRSRKKILINLLEQNIMVPRKVLERHRKYIIAAVEILSGEYPCLADYIRYIKKELNE